MSPLKEGSLWWGGSSFVELLRHVRVASGEAGMLSGVGGASHPVSQAGSSMEGVPVWHGTTVLALRTASGVVMAADRQASEGYQVADRAIHKIFPVDRGSAVAIAGAAGPAIEMARLFRVEIEHYEKLEGVSLTLLGKSNKLGQMVREHLPLAMQGLVVVPLYAGYDDRSGKGRIFKFDAVGGRYEEEEYHANGSGGLFARNVLKMFYRPGLSDDEGVKIALRALYEAADEDLGTGGPDFVRGIFPTVYLLTAEGVLAIPSERVSGILKDISDSLKRQEQP
ncbi:MAG: proteasome subunit beta [Leptospirales bacterium]